MAEEEGKIKIKYVVDDTQLQQAVNKAMGSFKQMSSTAEKEGNKVKDMFATMAKAAGGFFSVAAAMGFAKQIVAVRKEVESLEISFGTLLGSEQKAASLMRELSQFAAKTPLQLNDLARGAQMLLSFNVEAERVMPILHAIGDISMGDAGKLQSLTLAFSQMSSTGRLMGQDLLQMINAGFNPLTVIAEKTGKSVAQLKDEMSKGAISAKQVEEAFIDATSAGGKFYGMLEKQSKGLGGSLSNLEGAIRDMMNEIGTAAQAPLVNVVQKLTELVQNYKEVGKIVGQIVIVYGTYRAALIAHAAVQKLVAAGAAKMTAAELAHYGALQLVSKIKNLKLANPYALAAAAVAALVIQVTKYVKLMNTAERLQKDMNAANDKAAASLALETKRVDDLFTALNKAKKGTDEYNTAIQNIQNQYGGYLENLKIEADTLKDSADAQERLKKAIIDTAKARIAAGLQEEAGNMLLDATKNVRENIDKSLKSLAVGYNNATRDAISETLKKAAAGGDQATIDKQIGLIQKKINETYDQYAAPINGAPTMWQQQQLHLIKLKANLNEYVDAMKVYENEMRSIENTYGSTTDPVVGSGGGGGGTTSTLTDEQKKKMEDLKKSILKGEQDIAEARLDIRRKVEQEQINIMQEGAEKTKQQIEHNYQLELDAINKTERDLLAKQNELDKNKWLKSGKSESSFVAATKLDPEAQKWIDDLREFAKKMKENQLAEATKQVLSNYLTYQERKDAAFKQFYDAISLMDKNDADYQRRYDEAKRQYDNAIKGINQEFASRSKDFEAWAAYVTNLSLDKLQVLLTQAEAELSALDTLDENDERLADLNAKIQLLKDQIASLTAQKNAKNSVDKALGIDQNTINRLQVASNVLGNMGGEVKGLIGEFVEMDEGMKQLVDTIIDMGVELAKSGIDEAAKLKDATADIGDEADNIAKSADWITMALKVLLAIVKQILSVTTEFDKEVYNLKIQEIERNISNLQRKIDNIDFSRAFDLNRGEYDSVMRDLSTYFESVRNINNEIEKIGDGRSHDFFEDSYELDEEFEKLKRLWKELHELDYQKPERLEKISKLIADISSDYNGFANRIKDFSDTVTNYSKQIYELKQAVEEAKAKAAAESKDKVAKEYEQQAAEYEEQIKEALQNSVEYIKQYMEEVFGGSAMSLAEKFGDAIIDAFKSGADAAVAFGETVNDVMRNMVRQLIYQKIILPQIEEIFNKYEQELLEKQREQNRNRGGGFPSRGEITNQHSKNEEIQNDVDWWLENVGRIYEDLSGLGEVLQTELGNIDPNLLNYLQTGTSSSTSSRGIAQASQDSIDELNGRMTMIQEHTAMLSGNMVTLVGNTNGILLSVKNIDNNVEAMNSRMSDMAGDIRALQSDVNYIRNVGINAL